MRRIYIPILAQITIPYILLAILLASLGTYLVTRGVFDTVEERFTNQLLETGLRADENIVREENSLLEVLRLISNVQGIAGAIDGQGLAELQGLVLPIAYNAGLEAVAILAPDGQERLSLILDVDSQTYGRLAPLQPWNEMDFVAPVLRGEADELGDKYGGFTPTDQGSLFFVAGPIRTEAGLAGVILVGQRAATLAETIRQQTLAQVSFYDLQGAPLTSSFTQPAAVGADQVIEVLARQTEGSFQRRVTDSGIEYRELLVTLEVREGVDAGLMGLALPENFIAQTNQITRANTYLLIGTGLLLAILVGVFVAGRITRPIQDLKEAAQRVAEGNLQIKVQPRGQDEVGVLSNSFNSMVDSLNKSQTELISTYNKTIEGWARALDLRDHETEGHSRRVADLSVELATFMGLKGEQLEHIKRGALLHDIGKIAIPDSILLKEGSLTQEEIATMRQHPVYAQLFMGEIEFLRPAMDIPVSHHEKWDGSGYPKGLRGEEIPLAARIFAVVDVWDALTSDRPYRKALIRDEALAYLQSESGRHFDPEVVKAFRRVVDLLR